MPVHYFKCFNCDQMFVAGVRELPNKLVCVMGQCDIREISEEEAEKNTEEIRNEE